MTSSERYEQILTLVTQFRDVAESGFRHLAERVGEIERKFGGGADAPVELIRRAEAAVRRVEEMFASGGDAGGIALDFKALCVSVEKLDRHLAIVHRIVADGAQMDFPWFHIRGDENGHKCAQVTKVWKHLKDNPECRRSRAVKVTFVPDPLGYSNMSALLSACQRLEVEKYRNC